MRRLICVSLCVAGVASAQPPTDQPPPPPEPEVPPSTVPASTPVAEPAPAPAEPPRTALPNYEPTVVTLGGYLQPQFRKREDSPAQGDTDGFRFARARLIAQAKTTAGNLELSAFIEAEMQPDFSLQDGYISVARDLPHAGRVVIDGGQMRVPISRQNMLSDSRLSFVDKGQIATIAPGRDLGTRVAVTVPYVPQIRVWGSTFNGEGRNQVENINQRYLWATRVEVTPFGRERQLAESAFGGKFLTIAGSFGSQILDAGDRTEHIKFYGFDVAGAYRGLSGTFEYLYVDHDFRKSGDQGGLPPDFVGNGWVAQLAYILPFHLPPHGQSAFELGFRVEEIDRNDEVPISLPGDPEQSVRGYTGVASYYLRGHTIKAQLAVSHLTELEDMTGSGEDAAYDNDQVLLQVTYRLE